MPAVLAGCAHHQAAKPSAAVPENPFYAWFGIDDGVIRRVMSELTARGATHAELYFQHKRSNHISLEDGLVSKAHSDIDQGVGLRVVVGDQVGFAFTEDLDEAAMKQAARTATAIAKGQPHKPIGQIATKPVGHQFYKVSLPWSEVGIDQKIPKLQRAEQLAKAADPAVSKVSVRWNDTEERVLVANLHGDVRIDTRPMVTVWVTVNATKNGQTFSNGASLSARYGMEGTGDAQLARVARQAVDRTMRLFDAVRPPAGALPVVLAPGASGILLHEAIGHGLEADFNRKGTSIYASMLNQRIAPENVTIVDDGTVANQRGALNVDDEGHDTKRTVLVEKGILRGYLHDQISAQHYKVPTTGSGRRQSFRHIPMPRMRCTYMENGPHTREEIIASIKGTGIIAETFTNGQVQIGAGDYTFYVKNGWLIENGKIKAPIKDANIIGNGPESLRRVTMVGNDFAMDETGWNCGKAGQSVPVSLGLPSALGFRNHRGRHQCLSKLCHRPRRRC